jgi:hypothetical protein
MRFRPVARWTCATTISVGTWAIGLYVCGLHFQHSTSSTMIHGTARDADYVADKIGERMRVAAKQAGREVLHRLPGAGAIIFARRAGIWLPNQNKT